MVKFPFHSLSFLQIEFHSWKSHTYVSTRMVLQAAKHGTFNYSKCELKSVNEMKMFFHCIYNPVFYSLKCSKEAVRHIFWVRTSSLIPHLEQHELKKEQKAQTVLSMNGKPSTHTCLFCHRSHCQESEALRWNVMKLQPRTNPNPLPNMKILTSEFKLLTFWPLLGFSLTPCASVQCPWLGLDCMPQISGVWVYLRSKVCQQSSSCCVKLLVNFTYQTISERGHEKCHTQGSDTDMGVTDVWMCLVCVICVMIHKP